jgi:hypothetical protein
MNGGSAPSSVESLLLCNDPHGLCVAQQGGGPSRVQDAGVYTNIVRLAAQLPGAAESSPLVIVEMPTQAVLVKDYAGYAVAVTVPKQVAAEEAAVEG